MTSTAKKQLDRYRVFCRDGDWSDWDPDTDVWPSLGAKAVEWIESNCIFGEGDRYGELAQLTGHWSSFCYEWFEYQPDKDGTWLSWRYKRALEGAPKGDAKTQSIAWVAMVSTFGPYPITPVSPNSRIAAASWDQADELFDCVQITCGGQGGTVAEAPMAGFFDVWDSEVTRRDGLPGKIHKIAAAAGTTDGAKPTLFIADELHEWIGNKRRVHIVNSNGIRKRRHAREINISTAGLKGQVPPRETDPLLWQLYLAGLEKQKNPGKHKRFLFRWRAADDTWKLDDPDQLEQAIQQASGESLDVLYTLEDRVERFHDPEITEADYRRYFLNQWTNVTGDWWLNDSPTAWAESAIKPYTIPADAPVFVGVDMSLANDSTAVGLVHELDDGRELWRARVWTSTDGHVDYESVSAHLVDLIGRYEVRAVYYDPRYFEEMAQRLQTDHRKVQFVAVSQAREARTRMDRHAYQQIVGRHMAHEDDPLLTDHVSNAVWRESEGGRVLSKSQSARQHAGTGHIDSLMANVFASWARQAWEPQQEPVRGVFV